MKWTVTVLSALLAASPLLADGKNDRDAATRETPSAPASAGTEAKPAEKPAAAEFAAEIEQLRQMVLEQARQMEAQQKLMQEQQARLATLTEELRSAHAAGAAPATPAPVASSTAAAPQEAALDARVAKIEADVAANKKSSEEGFKALGSLKLTGDIRLRYEPFFGGGPASGAALPTRNRERYRFRLNGNTKLGEDFNAGFAFASGDTGDPISTNSTETGFFTRKPFAVDRAFITYHPHAFKALSVTGGKFAYTWQKTELTWDVDLNPEGVSEQLMWDWKDKILTHFGVVAFQLPMWEVSGGPDSGVIGGQIQTGFKAGSRVKLGANFAFYNYRNADRIAQNLNGGAGFATNGTATPYGGTYGFGGSGITNNFGTIGTTRYLASQFGIADVLLRADIDTGHAKWPVVLIADYVQNTRACSNLQVFYDAQILNPAQVIPACDKHQRYGHWLEAQFGQTKNPRDMRIGYTFMRIDRDAVVSAFNFSDIRQATNDANHRLEFYYQAYKNITVGVTGLFGRQLVTAQSPTPERYLKRFQFDVIYAF
ncbi:MAG: putative porin [Acidobacteriia bacterium]|nr:putative porin [Terriglobia bacterium]